MELIKKLIGVLSDIMKALFLLCALSLIMIGISLRPESAVHEIYQLNAITSGLIVMVATGLWMAIDNIKR